MDQSTRQKLTRDIRKLTDIMTQTESIDIYRSFYPNTKEYTFFSVLNGTFFKIDHVLGHKGNLNG